MCLNKKVLAKSHRILNTASFQLLIHQIMKLERFYLKMSESMTAWLLKLQQRNIFVMNEKWCQWFTLLRNKVQMQYKKLYQSNKESKQWTCIMIMLVERYCKTCMSFLYLQVAMTFICTLKKRFSTLLSLTQISISFLLLTISWRCCKQLHNIYSSFN